MGRARDPNRDKAFEVYKDHKGNIDLIEIANQLSVPDGTVRGWKAKDSWDDKLNGTFQKEKERNGTDKNISWIKIEKEYVTDIRMSPCTLEELALKYNVSVQAMKNQSMKNEWSRKRTEYKQKVNQKAVEKSVDKDADRIIKLLSIVDKATAKAEQSLDELETYLIRNKKKTKVIEYKDLSAIGKPTKEVIDEEEMIDTMPGPVDRQGLLYVTSSLKNIKELYAITSDAKMQEHKIDYDNKNLELARAKAQLNDNDGTVEDDGFLDALAGKVDEIWSEE